MDEKDAIGSRVAPNSRTKRKVKAVIEGFFALGIAISPVSAANKGPAMSL